MHECGGECIFYGGTLRVSVAFLLSISSVYEFVVIVCLEVEGNKAETLSFESSM